MRFDRITAKRLWSHFLTHPVVTTKDFINRQLEAAKSRTLASWTSFYLPIMNTERTTDCIFVAVVKVYIRWILQRNRKKTFVIARRVVWHAVSSHTDPVSKRVGLAQLLSLRCSVWTVFKTQTYSQLWQQFVAAVATVVTVIAIVIVDCGATYFVYIVCITKTLYY